MKTKKTKTKKINMLGIPVRTAASKSIRVLKWKLKDARLPGQCIKQGCSKTKCERIFCKKHNKILRKEQLRLNNIPWRKKKSQPGYKPKQMHLVYKGKATKATLADEKRARKRVKLGKSTIITSQKMLNKAMEAAKAERKENRKPVKIKVTNKTPNKVKIKVKHIKPTKVKAVKAKKRGKIATAMDEETIDLT